MATFFVKWRAAEVENYSVRLSDRLVTCSEDEVPGAVSWVYVKATSGRRFLYPTHDNKG